MMTSWKRIFLRSLVMLTIVSLLLTACGPDGDLHKRDANPKNEEQQKGSDKDKDKDKEKEDTHGQEVPGGGAVEKITICHRTGSAKHPYVEIRVSKDAIKDGHGTHAGDIIPAPENGCPGTVIATDVPAK